MVKTRSLMTMPLGTKAPPFSLWDAWSNRTCNFEELTGKQGTVVMFICNHCPFVIHLMDELIRVSKTYRARGIGFIAINSNDIDQYPEDGILPMKQQAKQLTFPYLHDATQVVAKAYHAACTPDFFVFDCAARCVYRGRFDGATPNNNEAVTGGDLRAALDALLKGDAPLDPQQSSVGCNIKWRE